MKKSICERLEAAAPALLVVACSAILVATAINFEPTRRWVCYGYAVNESCVRRLLYDFQTLIATFVALVTVMLTRRQLLQAAQMHKEQMRIAQQPAISASERFVGQVVDHMSLFAKQARDACASGESLFDSGKNGVLRSDVAVALMNLAGVRKTLESEPFKAMERLYPEELASRLRQFFDWSDCVRAILKVEWIECRLLLSLPMPHVSDDGSLLNCMRIAGATCEEAVGAARAWCVSFKE